MIFFLQIWLSFKCKIVAFLSSGTQAGGVLLLYLSHVRPLVPVYYSPLLHRLVM